MQKVLCFSSKCGTDFPGTVAYGNHKIEFRLKERLYMFRLQIPYRKSSFPEDLDRQRMNPPFRFRPSRVNRKI